MTPDSVWHFIAGILLAATADAIVEYHGGVWRAPLWLIWCACGMSISAFVICTRSALIYFST